MFYVNEDLKLLHIICAIGQGLFEIDIMRLQCAYP
jgi:hypothetical protein